MSEFISLYSGSSGNCSVVRTGEKYIIIDMGKGVRTTSAALKELGLNISDCAGILVTHEHSDHVKGLATFLKKNPLPVYGADDTLDFLDEYLTEMKITGPIKLWIVGYSRSAVTANMVGGALDSGYQLANGTTVAFDDLFVYTFEPPQGSMKSTTRGNYSNIHNIINGNDLVAMLAPSAWDFARFNSNNDWIPSAAGTRDFIKYRKNMLRMLEAIYVFQAEDGIRDKYWMPEKKR